MNRHQCCSRMLRVHRLYPTTSVCGALAPRRSASVGFTMCDIDRLPVSHAVIDRASATLTGEPTEVAKVRYLGGTRHAVEVSPSSLGDKWLRVYFDGEQARPREATSRTVRR